MRIFSPTAFQSIFFLLAVNMSILCVVPQVSETPFDCSTAEKLTQPIGTKVITLGIIQGKAIHLTKPPFPAAAKQLGIRGSVQVTVLIDTRGCVSEATALSGHPLLVPASLQAAMKSSFAPLLLNQGPVWVTGLITYNFVSEDANWLEIGFSSDSLDKLIKHLPTGFDRLRTELKTADDFPFDERQKVIASASETIRVELIPFPKEQWLFDLGRKLRAMSKTGATKELKSIVETAPTGVSPQLIVRLDQLIEASTTGTFWKKLKEIETLMFQLGN